MTSEGESRQQSIWEHRVPEGGPNSGGKKFVTQFVT